MKLRRAVIDDFRGVKHVEIDFFGPDGQPRPVTAIFGDNGSGKTTVLQAIALTMSLQTKAIRDPTEFQWHGFIAERMKTLGETRVLLTIEFGADEITAACGSDGVASLMRQGRTIPERTSADSIFDGTWARISSDLLDPSDIPSRHCSRFRELAGGTTRLGDVFWFDQFRGLPGAGGTNGAAGEPSDSGQSWLAGVDDLRRRLISMWTYHLQPIRESGPDRIPELEQRLARIWPGTTIRGLQPRRSSVDDSLDAYWFMFERNGRVFELSEMSSGEQAVFPLLYRFLRLDINHSIVLIDELELHLHPPEQQALLAALPKLGNDCQFIITSHSQYLSDVIPGAAQVHLSEGERCE